MSGGVLGGGVIFVVAALLWAAVLVPAWLRRREFRAAERNALRLQRTLRVLAETSEMPQEVRLEATARQALAQEKLLRTAQKRQEAEREARLAEERAEQVRAEIRAQAMQRREAAARRAAKLRRPLVRRVRACSALALVLGLLGALVGTGQLIAGSGSALLFGSLLLGVTGLGALVLLAPGRARMKAIPAERVETTAVSVAAEESEPAATGETDAAAEAHAAAQRAAAERIARARAMARARAEKPASREPRENQSDSILLHEAREQVARARSGAQQSDGSQHPDGSQRPDGVPAAPAAPAAAGSGAGGSAAGSAPGSVSVDSAAGATASAPASKRPAAADAHGSAEISASVGARRAPRATSNGNAARAAQLRQMGVIGDTSEGMPDLDAVLRRRRSAG